MRTTRTLLALLAAAAALAAAATDARAQGAADPPARDLAPAEAGEVDALRGEVERLREIVERQGRALAEMERRVQALSPAAGEASSAAPQPAAPQPAAPQPAAPQPAAPPAPADARQAAAPAKSPELEGRVDELWRRFGKLRLSGDIQLRYEGFSDQGFDLPADVPARNRFRARVRAQLSGEISKHFDWGIRLASGSFDNPISPQQTLTDYYNRKPIAIDRAYLHFDSKTERVGLELWGGKFEAPWRRTPLTFDEDVQPEGLAEVVKVDVGAGPLRDLRFTAWQLPYRERAVGADAVLFGGQVLTDWRLSSEWGLTLAGAFHDFEQVDVIPPATGISPALVNAGFDYGTTNAVFVNALGVPEYRSEYRVVDAIAELRYAGFGSRSGGSSAWPVLLRADWIHNTSAFNSQKDGGQLEAIVGRRQEAGDWQFEYVFWKVEREAFPSVFMDSEMVIQTNSLTHAARARYQLHKQVEIAGRYFWTRRLETTSPVNRWLDHYQVDVQYRF